MNEKVQWGVLGAAKIAQKKVIPAMQGGELSHIRAIASRDGERARTTAEELGIPVSYGSYEELLSDPEIEAVYIPLPNHLHVEWSRRALEAGKHVLCEKPLALKVEDVDELMRLRDKTGLKIGEAFMVDSNTQWIEARKRVRSGEIGRLRAVNGVFSYNNPDPENIRNRYLEGGGGMWDIGCYPVHSARYMFGEEPSEALAVMEKEAETGVDTLASGILSFPSGTLCFTCSTRIAPYQKMSFYGTGGSLSVDIPYNQLPNNPQLLFVDRAEAFPPVFERVELPPADQYRLQGDAFSKAIREDGEVPVPLENTRLNTAALLAIFRSAESGKRELVRLE